MKRLYVTIAIMLLLEVTGMCQLDNIDYREQTMIFSDVERQELKLALIEAKRMSAQVLEEMNQIWNQSGEGKREKRLEEYQSQSTFMSYWGYSKKQCQLRKLKHRIQKIDKWLNEVTIKIIPLDCSSDKCKSANTGKCNINSYANYFLPGRINSLKIWICPNFFGRPTHAQAGTIIHELIHELGFRHQKSEASKEVVLSEDGCIKLASSKVRSARKNPDNYKFAYFKF